MQRQIPIRHRVLFKLTTLFVLLHFGPNVEGGEQLVVRFRESPSIQSNIVHLGDLVEVLSGQSESFNKLLNLALGPAPRDGQKQRWKAEHILEHLHLRGVHPSSVRWQGKNEVEVLRSAANPLISATMTPAFVDDRTLRQAQDNVVQAITEYLSFKTGEPIEWRISVDVPTNYVRILQSKRSIISIGGGTKPFTGEQQFVLKLKQSSARQPVGSSINITVAANVALPPMVVTAARPLRREEILSAEALTFRPLSKRDMTRRANGNDPTYFAQIEDLVGKQLRRAVSTGLPIQADYVGDPILISRNTLIEIESVAGSVVVSTQGRALNSGAEGDLIQVELLSDRNQKLFATVVDHLTVRIAAQPARIRSDRNSKNIVR